ncbi:MAG: hypothetical protein GY809_16090, partial [Planctomycetes bacterium]|nr:hypothetical protein [Planctomycetota bacterium]
TVHDQALAEYAAIREEATAEEAKNAWVDAALKSGEITEEEAQAKRQAKKQRTQGSTGGKK